MRICTILVCLAFGQGISAQAGSLLAIGYVVSDINRSERFYTEVIGMQPAGSFQLDTTWSREAGVADNRPFAVKMFRMGTGQEATRLKLAYFEESSPRPAQSGLDTPAGINYLTLNYESLQPVVNRLNRADIPILGYVRWEGYQLIFIRDPDGLYLELVGPPEPAVQLD